MRDSRIRICLGILAAMVLLSACGSSNDARKAAPHHGQAALSPANVCRHTSRQAVAGLLRLPATSVATTGSTGNNLMPQCTFTAPVAGNRVQLIANISNGPQPFMILERTAVEASQVFTTTPLFQPPQNITGLGLDADWFPPEQHLMTTDGRVLVTVTVSWQHAKTARKISTAVAVACTYLGPNDSTAAKLYP
jgi:hypothetical protein